MRQLSCCGADAALSTSFVTTTGLRVSPAMPSCAEYRRSGLVPFALRSVYTERHRLLLYCEFALERGGRSRSRQLMWTRSMRSTLPCRPQVVGDWSISGHHGAHRRTVRCSTDFEEIVEEVAPDFLRGAALRSGSLSWRSSRCASSSVSLLRL